MIPADLLTQIDALVAKGYFPDRQVAIEEVVRQGLNAVKEGLPNRPPRPPMPPGRHEPTDDRPINVNPSDVNWMK